MGQAKDDLTYLGPPFSRTPKGKESGLPCVASLPTRVPRFRGSSRPCPIQIVRSYRRVPSASDCARLPVSVMDGQNPLFGKLGFSYTVGASHRDLRERNNPIAVDGVEEVYLCDGFGLIPPDSQSLPANSTQHQLCAQLSKVKHPLAGEFKAPARGGPFTPVSGKTPKNVPVLSSSLHPNRSRTTRRITHHIHKEA